MGVETAIGLGLLAAGTGAQAYNSYDTARRADRAEAQGIRQQAVRQRQADERVAQEVGAVQRSTPEAATQASTNQFLQQLRASRAQAEGGETQGAVSNDFTGDLRAAREQSAARGVREAGNLGAINAPALQREREAQGFARLGNDLGQIQNAANSDAFLQQLRASRIRPNSGLEVFSQLATGAGSGLVGRGGNGTPKTKPPKRAAGDSLSIGRGP